MFTWKDRDYPYPYEIGIGNGKNMIVWMKDMLCSMSDCMYCKTRIFRGKTENNKMIPVSRDTYGSLVSHFTICPNMRDVKKTWKTREKDNM